MRLASNQTSLLALLRGRIWLGILQFSELTPHESQEHQVEACLNLSVRSLTASRQARRYYCSLVHYSSSPRVRKLVPIETTEHLDSESKPKLEHVDPAAEGTVMEKIVRGPMLQ